MIRMADRNGCGTLYPKEITQHAASDLFASCDRSGGRYCPLGLFYLKENAKFIGIDNSSGNAWTEEFSDLAACIAWLREGACPPFGGKRQRSRKAEEEVPPR